MVPLAAVAERAPWVPDARAPALPAPVSGAARPHGLWGDPVRFLALIDGVALARWALAMARRRQGRLPAPRHPGGAPRTDRDQTVPLRMPVLRARRLSREKMADGLARGDDLAVALGMPPGGRPISAAQLSRRSRPLGLWPDFVFFFALVWQLLRLGAVSGAQLVLDARSWGPGTGTTRTRARPGGAGADRPSASSSAPWWTAGPTCRGWSASPPPRSTS